MDSIEEAKQVGWTDSQIQNFKGYGDMVAVQSEIAALESPSTFRTNLFSTLTRLVKDSFKINK